MPTTYAHWRFGVDCIDTLPDEYRKIILDHRELFDFGVHGPDIFFYDLKHPEIPKYGSSLHRESARKFFDNAIDVYGRYEDGKEAMLSYMLGFLSHFALDSQCHGYINNKDYSSEILTHNKVESEYDGYLMRQEGFSVSSVNRAKSLKPSKETARIMARFFPLSEEVLLRTTRWHKFFISALYCRTDLKRNVGTYVLDKLKNYKNRDLIVQKNELGLCKDSNLRIDKLKAYALELYPRLAKELIGKIKEGKELGPYFDRDFDPDPDESTPVLSYEEELRFIPEKNIIK